MRVSRRSLMSRAWIPFLLAAPATGAQAETATYKYDALGRLVRVTFSDGHVVQYAYDAAGNRIELARTDGSTFSQTIQIMGTGPVNLRTLANNAGYTGLTSAMITFQVGSAVTVMGTAGAATANGGHCIDTGIWPTDVSIALTLEISGKVYGGGGGGGYGAGGANGSLGQLGGDAIYCRENLTVLVNAGGQIKGGGGGGGGGGAWTVTWTDAEGFPESTHYNGGQGGGGFPNGQGGSPGTTSGGGAGGAGETAFPTTRINGAGGAGGGAAAAGAYGIAASGSGGTGASRTWFAWAQAVGGQPGYAVRKNGKTVNVTNNGTIVGTQG